MDLNRFFHLFDKVDRLVDRVIELIFMTVAAAFGAWLVWTILSAADISLLARLGAALTGAVVSAILMWLFWFVARYFV